MEIEQIQVNYDGIFVVALIVTRGGKEVFCLKNSTT